MMEESSKPNLVAERVFYAPDIPKSPKSWKYLGFGLEHGKIVAPQNEFVCTQWKLQ